MPTRVKQLIAVGIVTLCCGCRKPRSTIEIPPASPSGHTSTDQAKANHADGSERLKMLKLPDGQIDFGDGYIAAAGMWLPESSDPSKHLVFPEQAKIECNREQMSCREEDVSLGLVGGMIIIQSIEDKVWPVTSWDGQALSASYGPVSSALAASDRCHSHALFMTFASGAITTADIPTHNSGCDEFPETDTYRLIRGNYYIDTTPQNDMEKR